MQEPHTVPKKQSHMNLNNDVGIDRPVPGAYNTYGWRGGAWSLDQDQVGGALIFMNELTL